MTDGHSSPVDVARYYKELGYDFLGISDHNACTPVATYADQAGILGIPCCEYTGEECCHVVAAGVVEPVAPNLKSDDTWERAHMDDALKQIAPQDQDARKVLILQDGIDKTIAANGLPIICHPFWKWTYDHRIARQLRNCTHFELCNASPDCNSHPLPGKSHPDEMWDALLSAGIRIIGLASDDAHWYTGPYQKRGAVGGTGWNMVKAPALTQTAIMEALRQGHCYASTGILLADYRVHEDGISLAVECRQSEQTCLQFFGEGGRELQCDYALTADYRFKGEERYVRCRITSTTGVWGWTQPVFLDDLQNAIAWTAGLTT